MQLKLSNKTLDLNLNAVAGMLDVPAGMSGAHAAAAAAAMMEHGAEIIDLACPGLEREAAVKTLVSAIESIREATPLYIAVHTSDPEVMKAAVKAGAELIIDPLALRAEGALAAAAELSVPVCLIYDQTRIFAEGSNDDPISAVSEFFYERIDACLNAGIKRSRLMLDPSLGAGNDLEFRLKLMGRLKSFKSFALPLSLALPPVRGSTDAYVMKHVSVASVIGIFSVSSGVSIIRTPLVEDMTLALDVWQLLHASAKPFKLSTLFKRSLQLAHNKRHENKD